MPRYSRSFFARRHSQAQRSAQALSPTLVDLLKPRSVVDIGCGDGAWLAAMRGCGVARTLGVDGPWSPCPGVVRVDFAQAPLPFDTALDRGAEERFDLALCLELLEHLPEERGTALVRWLARLSDTLLVSAAVPGQGGTGHVSERWPGYWTRRFAELGYVACDFLRPAIWSDERIAPWYRQNLIGYFRPSVPEAVAAFAQSAWAAAAAQPMAIVHPALAPRKRFWDRRMRGLTA